MPVARGPWHSAQAAEKAASRAASTSGVAEAAGTDAVPHAVANSRKATGRIVVFDNIWAFPSYVRANTFAWLPPIPGGRLNGGVHACS